MNSNEVIEIDEFELSSDKQERMQCCYVFGVDNWNCYTDCAFWNHKKCTYLDSE